MPYCPNCGAEVDPDDATCWDCETSLTTGAPGGDRPDERPGGESGDRRRGGRAERGPRESEGRQPRRGEGEDRPPRGDQGRRSSQGERNRQSPQGDRGRRPARDGHQRGGDGQGTDRRTLLKYGGGAVGLLALAGGGWFAYDNFLSGGSGPKAVVRGFYDAINRGDVAAANSYIHPDSPTGEISQSELENVDRITVEELEVVERTGDTARVRATLSFASTGGEPTDQVLELRTSGGEWKLYE